MLCKVGYVLVGQIGLWSPLKGMNESIRAQRLARRRDKTGGSSIRRMIRSLCVSRWKLSLLSRVHD